MDRYVFASEMSYQKKTTSHPVYKETGLHSHDQYEVLFVETGNGELLLQDGRLRFSEETMILIPPHTPHYITLMTDVPYQRAVLNFCKLPEGVSPDLFRQLRSFGIGRHPQILSVWKRMEEYSELFSGQQAEMMLRFLLTELLMLTEKLAVFHQPDQYGAFMHRAMEYIDGHITEVAGVEELCRELHVSRAYLYREFQKTLGCSPKRYINEKRLHIARSLIRLGEEATVAAERCGYKEYSAFYRAYCAYFGYSPRATRII